MDYNLPFILLHISNLLILVMLVYIIKMKNKSQIHYAFIGLMISLLVWGSGELVCAYNNYSKIAIIYFYFIGVIFTPYFLLLVGIVFARTNINFNLKYKLLLIPQIFLLTILFTNKYHHLYFIKTGPYQYGWFYAVHTTILYTYIFIGLWYLLYYSIKNSGFFSKQSSLLVAGTSIPFIFNILETLKIIHIHQYTPTSTFSFAIICFALAIFKFDLLNIVPIALQKVVDHISDSFIVIDENYNIIDYNNTFHNNFKDLIQIKRSKNLLVELSKGNIINIDKNEFEDAIKKSINEKNTVTLEKTIKYSNHEKIFNIDITSIFNHDKHIGTILLFKDITALKNAHKQLLEQERFSSLGQLIGGIAHDMNSRLYALDGQLYLMNNYVNEIKSNENLERLDYVDVANDVLKQIDEMKTSVSSMSKTIDSVRNHTRNYAFDNVELFSMSKVIETIESLLNQKLQRHNCTLTYKQNKEEIYIKGDFSKFESVLINIISNAIESYSVKYEKMGGTVEVYAEDKQNEVIISVTDHGKGIPENIRDLIFKEVLTTKGANGTGMGLYFSHSIIVGNFNGDIWFESEVGKGTTFYVRVSK